VIKGSETVAKAIQAALVIEGHSTKASAKPIFRASVQDDGALEMLVYGDIVDSPTLSMLEAWGYPTDGLISASSVKQQIDAAGGYSKIRVRINSPGGDAFEGIAIHNLLRAQAKPIETCVDGVAASSASIIAMAGDVRKMGHNAMMMIHNAWSACTGNGDDMRKMADTLDKVSASIGQTYADKTGISMDKIKSLMDEETWMSADDCVRDGFATEIADPPAEPADVNALAQRFMARFKKNVKAEDERCACDCENCTEEDCADCTNKECNDLNCKDCPMQRDADAGNAAEVEPAAESNLSVYEAQLRLLKSLSQACTNRPQ
jgi:ATP-dependent protease ClpP protease subunit